MAGLYESATPRLALEVDPKGGSIEGFETKDRDSILDSITHSQLQIYKAIREMDALDVVRIDGEQQRVTQFILKSSDALDLDIKTTSDEEGPDEGK